MAAVASYANIGVAVLLPQPFVTVGWHALRCQLLPTEIYSNLTILRPEVVR